MGTAFATCFGYWFGIAGLLWVICYVCNTQISMIQILNVLVSMLHYVALPAFEIYLNLCPKFITFRQLFFTFVQV